MVTNCSKRVQFLFLNFCYSSLLNLDSALRLILVYGLRETIQRVEIPPECNKRNHNVVQQNGSASAVSIMQSN